MRSNNFRQILGGFIMKIIEKYEYEDYELDILEFAAETIRTLLLFSYFLGRAQNDVFGAVLSWILGYLITSIIIHFTMKVLRSM